MLRSTGLFQRKLADEARDGHEDVAQQRSRLEDGVAEQEGGMYQCGSDVKFVKGGRVGLGAIFFCFLCHDNWEDEAEMVRFVWSRKEKYIYDLVIANKRIQGNLCGVCSKTKDK